MVDILYFDYWTRGIRHFCKIDNDLKAQGYSTLLVHMGSQRGELVQDNHVISGISCQDIKLHGGNLVRMLMTVRPKVVLLLNNQTEDKIIIRACRNLNIKTIFLMHGIVVPLDKLHEAINLVDSSFGFIDRTSRFPKYVKLFFQYMQAAALRRFQSILDFEIYIYFVRQAISPGGNLAGKWKYKDSCADLAFVYSEEDRQLFLSCFDYEAGRVRVVGNYNLDDLYATHNNFSLEISKNYFSKYIVYVENGFSDPKYTVPGWSEKLVGDEVECLADIGNRHGYKLILKLHPSSDYSSLLSRFSNYSNIEVVLHCDLNKLISGANLVLGQSSSVLMMALAINKPIGILNIHPLPLKITTYKDRNLGVIIESFSDFEKFLISLQHHNSLISKKTTASINFIGPFDGQASKRISSNIVSLIN